MMKGGIAMYQKILVPLDGSPLAECVLSQVRNLAKGGLVGEIILINVVEIPSDWVIEGFDFVALKNANFKAAQEYLDRMEGDLSAEGLPVRSIVLEGRIAETIVDYAMGQNVDLIAMATQGYTGLKQVMFGSVALRVLHDAHAPILLVRPDSCRK
jgi:nucleotide-binding universal stress UspA family protein